MMLCIRIGLAYNIVANGEFKALLRAATGASLDVISRDTHNSYVDADFVCFCNKVAADLLATMECSHGLPFVSLFHDMYLDNAGHSVLGASVAYINNKWELKHVAVMGQKHLGSHAAVDVATAIFSCFAQRFCVELQPIVKFVMSDTTCILNYVYFGCFRITDSIFEIAAARNVAASFDNADQEDCLMHVLSLCMLYALGMRENTASGSVTTLGIRMPDILRSSLGMGLKYNRWCIPRRQGTRRQAAVACFVLFNTATC